MSLKVHVLLYGVKDTTPLVAHVDPFCFRHRGRDSPWTLQQEANSWTDDRMVCEIAMRQFRFVGEQKRRAMGEVIT